MNKSGRWKPYRLVLFNFFYFKYQEYFFKNGRLTLRGHNGSGKSVSMQTFFTFLLDGNRDPRRLDPFGARARKLQDLLLGKEEVNPEVQERIGYVFIEYKKEKTQEYRSCGFGLHAKRSSGKMDEMWGFVTINPYVRINAGHPSTSIPIYKDEKLDGRLERIPLTKKEFIEALGENGRISSNAEEYAGLVNLHLFKFPDIEGLKLFTEALVQMKSPKLGRTTGPKDIIEILQESLQRVTDNELAPLTNTVQEIDDMERKVERSEHDLHHIKDLSRDYNAYNRAILVEKAKHVIQVDKKCHDIENRNKSLLDNINQKSMEIEKLNVDERRLMNEQEALKSESKSLNRGDYANLQSEKNDKLAQQREAEQKRKEKEDRLTEKRNQAFDIKQKKEMTEIELEENQKEIEEHLESLEHFASESAFYDGHYVHHFKLRDEYTLYDYTRWEEHIKQHSKLLKTTLDEVIVYERLCDNVKTRFEEYNIVKVRHEQEEAQQSRLARNADEWKEESAIQVTNWVQELKQLTLEHTTLQEVTSRLGRFPTELDEAGVKEPVTMLKERQVISVNDTLNEVTVQTLELCKVKEHAEAELQAIIDTKELIPQLAQDKQTAFQFLLEWNIPFVPFYEAVEFKEGVDPQVRANLESAIGEMGLLTSCIVPSQFREQVKQSTSVIIPGERKSNNLSSYLFAVPTDFVGAADINCILESIAIEEVDGAYVLASGQFKTSLHYGLAAPMESALYIGKAAREQLKAQKIVNFELQISDLSFLIGQLQLEEMKLRELLLAIDMDYRSFPRFDEYKDAVRLYTNKKVYIAQMLEPELEEKHNRWKVSRAEAEKISVDLARKTEEIDIVLSSSHFEKALEAITEYLKLLSGDLKFKANSLAQNLRSLTDSDNKLDALSDDDDELTADIAELKDMSERCALSISAIEENLKDLNFDKVELRIVEIDRRLEELPQVKMQVIRTRDQVLNEKEGLEKELLQSKKETSFIKPLFEGWKKVFEEHLNECEHLFPLQNEMTPNEKLEIVLGFSKVGDKEENHARIRSTLSNSFANAHKSLPSYNLSLTTTESRNFPLLNSGEEKRAELILLEQLDQREIITMEFNAKRVSPHTAEQKLSEIHDEQKKAITEKESALFEKFLVDILGDVIKLKIRNSKEWVDRTNRFLEQADNNSGLRFMIGWKPLQTDKEDEMDTSDLAKLLDRDYDLLSPSNKEKITNHFRSKVAEAKKIFEREGIGTFQEVIREVMDYRKWFSFVISYEMTGMRKQELTTNRFDEFSGGEKALSTYTPLLAAVHARLQDAGSDAPRIFALDEAFAGVDDKNIREFFRLVERLDFDYTLNSQTLWGCYEEVSQLSIYELNRPYNGKDIFVDRYEWNGYEKIRINDINENLALEMTYEMEVSASAEKVEEQTLDLLWNNEIEIDRG